ncbi:MAG: hypothetical protein ACK41T_13025 [Pseudobdellovibrio sp.]
MLSMLSKLRTRLRKNLCKNERGQGATEYILLVAVVVGVVMLFKGKIQNKLQGTIGDIENKMDEVTTTN